MSSYLFGILTGLAIGVSTWLYQSGHPLAALSTACVITAVIAFGVGYLAGTRFFDGKW